MRKTAELSLVFAVPIVTNAKSKSRLCRLQQRLQKAAQEYINKLPNISEDERLLTTQAMEHWGHAVGWLNHPKHIGILVSFCADMLERSGFDYDPKIYELIVDIVDHLINGNDFKDEYIQEGHEAATLWVNLLKGEENQMTEDKVAEIVKAINEYMQDRTDSVYRKAVEQETEIFEGFVDYLRSQLPPSDEEIELQKQQVIIETKLRDIARSKELKFQLRAA